MIVQVTDKAKRIIDLLREDNAQEVKAMLCDAMTEFILTLNSDLPELSPLYAMAHYSQLVDELSKGEYNNTGEIPL